MKANEAPEKIYVVDSTFPDYVDFDGSPINTKRIDDHDIEYTRTDAFIEKAIKYVTNHFLAPGIDNKIEDFKNFLKGE